MSNYKQYLQSEEWKELRKKACIRASYKCEFCGADYEAVHHVEYPKNLKDDVLENLVVVCKVCHNKLHGIRKEIKPFTYNSTGDSDKEISLLMLDKFHIIAKASGEKYGNSTPQLYSNVCKHEDCDCVLVVNEKSKNVVDDTSYASVTCSYKHKSINVKFNKKFTKILKNNHMDIITILFSLLEGLNLDQKYEVKLTLFDISLFSDNVYSFRSNNLNEDTFYLISVFIHFVISYAVDSAIDGKLKLNLKNTQKSKLWR